MPGTIKRADLSKGKASVTVLAQWHTDRPSPLEIYGLGRESPAGAIDNSANFTFLMYLLLAAKGRVYIILR